MTATRVRLSDAAVAEATSAPVLFVGFFASLVLRFVRAQIGLAGAAEQPAGDVG